jgi:hypothetical protein
MHPTFFRVSPSGGDGRCHISESYIRTKNKVEQHPTPKGFLKAMGSIVMCQPEVFLQCNGSLL